MDAVQQANSGHPGMPMGMADIAEVLWRDYLKHNPKNPNWCDRDRFVLSNGHGCMLLYSVLHLTGYDVSIDDLKAFRQWESKTPGHPEYGYTPGVEATTGPLGQGLAMAVGMAIAEKKLAAEFNIAHHTLVDHYTYVFAGDGCLMEGISHEACSLAGTLKLGKLIVFYDDNGISIDGAVDRWFSDDTPARFESYHWHVLSDVNGHDPDAIAMAIEAARAEKNRPTLICCKTKIGFGSPNLSGSEKTHGAPLGAEEIGLTRNALLWEHEAFHLPEDVLNAWNATEAGEDEELLWQHAFAKYEREYPTKAAEFLRRTQSHLPLNWLDATNEFISDCQTKQLSLATRQSSARAIQFYSTLLPELMGGSADLSGSNGTVCENTTVFTDDNATGNYLHYGVREFGMSAIMNGMALHKGIIPFGGTFLTFVDYARNALRLSALMHQKVIYVYSHDSIGLGEDGPTHQPIEHTAMLRMTPNVNVWRPCDAVETAVSWQHALSYQGPSALLLTRQKVPHCERNKTQVDQIKRGGYVLYEPTQSFDVILIATGSEVHLALDAALQLEKINIAVRVVSMPSCDVFRAQDKSYQDSVLPPTVTKRIAIEAGVSDYWYQFVGFNGRVIGIDHFGASAPAEVLWEKYGFTVENIINVVKTL
jgi:transketolase